MNNIKHISPSETLHNVILELCKLGKSKYDIMKHVCKINEEIGLSERKIEIIYNKCVFEYCKKFGYNIRSMSVERNVIN